MTFEAEAKKRCRSLMSMPSVRIGLVSVQQSELNSANVPTEMRPMIRNVPPTSRTAIESACERPSIYGENLSHSSEALRFASL